MKSSLLERLELFNAAPFTIQRLCELLIDPRKQYSRIDKFMRALEKNILVVSTVEPGRKRTESENGDSLDSVVNGDLSLDVNVDIDMVENEAIFAMEAQNGNGSVTASVISAVTADNLIENKDKLTVSTPIISDVVTNAVRSGDDDILPNPKKAKLDLHDNNNAVSKATENNGEQQGEVEAIIKTIDANGSGTSEIVKEKSNADKILVKEEIKNAENILDSAEKNGNVKIDEIENIIKTKDHDEKMDEEKIVQPIETPETVEQHVIVKNDKMEKLSEEGKSNVIVDEKKIQEPVNEKTKDKDKMEKDDKSIDACKIIQNSNIPQKEIEIVVQQQENVVETVKENPKKIIEIEVLVENKDKNEICEKKDEVLSKDENGEKEDQNNKDNVEPIVAENGSAAIPVDLGNVPNEQTIKPLAEDLEKEVKEQENILEAAAKKIEAENISAKITEVKVTEKVEIELPKKTDEIESVEEEKKLIVQDNNNTAAPTEEKTIIMSNVEHKKIIATDEIPAIVAHVEKPTEAVTAAASVVEEKKVAENVVVTATTSPTAIVAVEKTVVETVNAIDVKPLAEEKTEKPSDDVNTIVADENVAAKSETELSGEVVGEAATAPTTITLMKPQPAIITIIDPNSPAPLIAAEIKDVTIVLPTVTEEDVITSTARATVVAATEAAAAVATTTTTTTTEPALLEAVPIISEPTLPIAANDIIAPTLTLNDQPMEVLPMEETVPEEVIMAETVMASIGSGLGVGGCGLVEMAIDAMEASNKDEPPVDGMDVDDNSQEAMDQ